MAAAPLYCPRPQNTMSPAFGNSSDLSNHPRSLNSAKTARTLGEYWKGVLPSSVKHQFTKTIVQGNPHAVSTFGESEDGAKYFATHGPPFSPNSRAPAFSSTMARLRARRPRWLPTSTGSGAERSSRSTDGFRREYSVETLGSFSGLFT